LAHLGVVVSLVGVALVATYSQERDIRMQVGDSIEMEGYRFEFKGVEKRQGPNYTSDTGTLVVYKGDNFFAKMHPEKRFYPARGTVMTEADIDAGAFLDIFVALGEPLADGAWAVRLQYKPFIRWIWLGGLMMMFAGLLSAFDKRYKRRDKQRSTSTPVASLA